MAKVKITSSVFKREVTTKNGVMYSYDIKVDGDDKVYQYLAKTNPQTKFTVGAEIEAELVQNGNYWNIKPAQTSGFGGGGAATASPQRLDLDRKIAALNNAVAMVIAGKVDADKLRMSFDKFLNEYLN